MATTLSTIAGITAFRATSTPCEHESSRATRVGQDDVANAWECDECGHLTPFTDADYAFANTSSWTPRAPEYVSQITWLFTSHEARCDFWAGR